MCEKLRYALIKHGINSVPCTTRKLKEVIRAKLQLIMKDKTPDVYIIPFITDKNNAMEHIRMT